MLFRRGPEGRLATLEASFVAAPLGSALEVTLFEITLRAAPGGTLEVALWPAAFGATPGGALEVAFWTVSMGAAGAFGTLIFAEFLGCHVGLIKKRIPG